ncbi:hypothetical protein [Maricaulis sp. CAU 1757]
MRFMRLVFLVPLLAAAPVGLAQDTQPDPTPQSIAMELFATASDAAGTGDFETARRLMESAAEIKPGHPAVLRALVTIAVRADRHDDAFRGVERMLTAGVVADLSHVEAELVAADAGRWAALQEQLSALQAPVGTASQAARIARPDALIEGVAMDIETDRLFLSSVTTREILLVEPFNRSRAEVFADHGDGLQSVFGLAVDDRTRMLWAGSGNVDQTPLEEGEAPSTALFAFDLVSGDLYRQFTIDGAGQIADFIVRDGIVYASDSQRPRIYVLDSVSGELRVLSEDPRFVSLQGVALARGALYVADYSLGIWRVDLADGSASLVRAGEESLIGIDGLRHTRDGRLIAVRNGAAPHQVMAIDLDAAGYAVDNVDVLLRGHPAMSPQTEPTLIAIADGRGWLVANAAWPLFPADGAPPVEERPETVILELDIP